MRRTNGIVLLLNKPLKRSRKSFPICQLTLSSTTTETKALFPNSVHSKWNKDFLQPANHATRANTLSSSLGTATHYLRASASTQLGLIMLSPDFEFSIFRQLRLPLFCPAIGCLACRPNLMDVSGDHGTICPNVGLTSYKNIKNLVFNNCKHYCGFQN